MLRGPGRDLHPVNKTSGSSWNSVPWLLCAVFICVRASAFKQTDTNNQTNKHEPAQRVMRPSVLHLLTQLSLSLSAPLTQFAMSDLEEQDSWQLIYDEKFRLSYKHLPHTTTHAFKASCILEAPPEVGGSQFPELIIPR